MRVEHKPATLKVYGLFIAAVLIWGSSYILMKKALLVFPPVQVGALRMLSACIVMAPLAIYSIWRSQQRYPWPVLALLSLTGNVLPAMLFPWAQTQLASSTVGALNALTPLGTLAIGVLFFHMQFRPLQLLGIVVGLLGSLLLVWLRPAGPGGQGAWYYAIIVLICTLLYAFNINYVKKHMGHLRSTELTSLTLFVAGLPALLALLFTDAGSRLASAPGQVAMGYIFLLGALGSGLALLLFYKLIQLSSAVFAASNTYFVPFVAMAWGLLDGETIGWGHLLGLCIILVGVYVANHYSQTAVGKEKSA